MEQAPEAEAEVLLQRDGAIATITLNRPERRNALSYAANRRLHALWEEIDEDPAIRAVILTSADCGTFCAGMDLKEAAALRASTGKDILQLLDDPFYERMRSVRVPIIAAMTGHFAAAGMVLAANSDLRVGLAGTSGGITEARVGRGTPWAAPMTAMLPLAVLMEMCATAQLLPVERLYALGFVNAVEATPEPSPTTRRCPSRRPRPACWAAWTWARTRAMPCPRPGTARSMPAKTPSKARAPSPRNARPAGWSVDLLFHLSYMESYLS